MRASRIASGFWLACCCLAPSWTQVEASLMIGAGMSYGTVTRFELCERPTSSTGSATDAEPSLHAGLDIGTRPYAGWGWRLSAEVNSRSEEQKHRFEKDGCGVTDVVFDTKGTFIDATASAIYIRDDWWGVSAGGGLTGYLVPGGHQLEFVAPVAQVGLFRALEFITFGADCSIGQTRLQSESFDVEGDSGATVTGNWWFATPRVRISVPFGRSAWLRSLKQRIPVGNPRG